MGTKTLAGSRFWHAPGSAFLGNTAQTRRPVLAASLVMSEADRSA
jgi:hypothetical protein